MSEPTTAVVIERLRHNRIELALHTLRPGLDDHAGGALLLLHGLGEASPATPPVWTRGWRGPVLALDFTGHGASTVPAGGGYTAELLLADADIALRHIGSATVVGRGLGAYIALMLAGTRADRVQGAVLADGPGLSGGPSVPTTQTIVAFPHRADAPDPYALFELGRDLRPPDYAATFARFALQTSPLDAPITVVARFRPAWLDAVANEHGVTEAATIDAALASYARTA